MTPKNLIKPLELVVSAIHCLREEKGSSPQTIMRYLVDKYNVNTEVLRPHVQAGLKRGLSFGLIAQDCGLYRLNDILGALDRSELGSGDSIKVKAKKKNIRARKRRLRKHRCVRRRALVKRYHGLQRSRKKPKLLKGKKRRTKHIFVGDRARRNGVKWRGQQRQKNKYEVDQLFKADTVTKDPVKTEPTETQGPTVSTKEQERERFMKA